MRISTAASWANALNNLSLAQDRQASANSQLSTQKVATDLMGYGRGSEVIASYQSSLSRTNSYLDVAQTVSDRLSSQDTAITTLGDSVTAAKDGIMSALANGSGSTIMVDLQGTFSSALSGLNYQHNGQYLFAGGNDAVPVNVSTLSQLGAATSAASVFTNGTIKKSSQIDANTTLQTGMLASDLGTQLMGIYKEIQNYNDDPTTGPFGAALTDAQKTFLTTKSQEFATVYNQVLEQGSLNGTLQKRVENTQTSLKGQASSLEQLVSNKTSADLAKAYTDLQQAQVAVQASAQVLSSLNNNTLLNLLK
ncbi:flagellin [Asticcacaulis sp. 201]|uniref:flagellin n=1 Tax=Asticcacaulis sp. 201 TaxID=3028787 RepID=UPI002915EDAC|nr:flagellin [Asticcacaulis sp. 201]MDV6331837.1 flagellin [Asticcacaulis sp. 201]